MRWARGRLDRLRRQYLEVIHEAEHLGEERLDELRHLVDHLGPSLKSLVDERLQALQTKLDEINRRLAEEAIPDERRSSVGHLALEKKAASAVRKASSVVGAGRRKSTAESGRASKSVAKSAAGKKKRTPAKSSESDAS
ncbi:hypothetical protein [Marinobacter sp. NFXS9]|uniref:hypothetical protein n=1 Tax=Marinobacter sp. NFXS9 TaxID=2818433 RepID=UPI0032E02D08